MKGEPRKPGGKPPTPTLPVVSSQAVLQNQSRPILELAVSPWPATQWTTHDYGMDAVLEVVQPRGDNESGYFNTGRRIGVQLKASDQAPTGTHADVAVHVRTVKYWLASHDPFAVVFCHVSTRRLSYRWIDDELVAELASRDATWFTRESVTIRVPCAAELASHRLDEFEREARNVVVRRHRVLAPGTYDRLCKEAAAAMDEVSKAVASAGFESLVALLREAAERVGHARYVVALAGRMRGGKSTLFNALVRREVSPVARRPTTAVPVLAIAGAEDAATVAFLDGRKESTAATAAALAAYATQDENPENRKGVRTIVVRLVSERLERGIAIVDAPGLFDPSDEIRAITARTLASAHAVLFVIDVSPASNGGFCVDSHVLDELARALDHSERVFLLLNKSEALTDEDREDVRSTLQSQVGVRGLLQRLAAPPSFISARSAWEWVKKGGIGESPIAEMERDVWDYLLRTNSTGVVRLETAVGTSLKAIDRAREFIAMRQSGAQEAAAVATRLATATAEVERLDAALASASAGAIEAARARLLQELDAIPRRIGDEMRAAVKLPSEASVSDRLNEHLEAVFAAVWSAAQRDLEQHALMASEQLERSLQQVRLDAEPAPQPHVLAPSFVLPPMDLLPPEALGFGAVAGFLTWLVAPGYAVAAAFGSFLWGALVGKRRQRARAIAAVEKKLRTHINGSVATPARSLLAGLESGFVRVRRYVADRWAVFEKEVLRQLSAAGSPLSADEATRAENVAARLTAARLRLERVEQEIRWTPELRS
jgi:hypothetical protein